MENNRYLFSYKYRIRNKKDFENLYKSKYRYNSEYFGLILCRNDFDYNRLAISIRKKVANAVKRNRMKRLIKEFFRLNSDKIRFNEFQDILFVVKRDFSDEKISFIEKEFLDLCQKLLII